MPINFIVMKSCVYRQQPTSSGSVPVAAQEMKTGHFKGKLLFPNYLFL